MTAVVKEYDGARSMEIELKDGVLYLDGGPDRFCYGFDLSIILRAIERETGTRFLRSKLLRTMAEARN